MTADEFEMDCHYSHSYRNFKEWDISVRDGGMKAEFSVDDEDIQEVVKDNFESFSDTFKEKLLDRIDDKWDRGEISDAERDTLLRVIEVILP